MVGAMEKPGGRGAHRWWEPRRSLGAEGGSYGKAWGQGCQQVVGAMEKPGGRGVSRWVMQFCIWSVGRWTRK